MLDIMLDLETMGNGPDAAIVAIGAVAFAVDSLEINVQGYSFYRVVNLGSSVENGGVIDPDTVMWWMKQGDQARAGLAAPGSHIHHTLFDFRSWVINTTGESVRMWGNGAAFDNVILASAYRRAGLAMPWKFWNDRCYRTVKALYPHISMERAGTHHNALDDAISQARHLQAIMRDHDGANEVTA